jgi:hypothetical protein
MKSAFVGAAAAAFSFAAMAGSAQALTMSDLASWDHSLVGGVFDFGGTGCVLCSTTGVYGETFTAPGKTIQDFTFEVDNFGTTMTGIYAEVFAWSGPLTGGNAPQGATGAPLFTTGPFTITGVDGYQAVHVFTNNTPLTVGDNYVILLVDTGPDGVQSEFGRELTHTAPGDGGFAFFNNDHTLGTVSGTWDDGIDFGSLAFSADFATPEPAEWALILAGFAGLGAALRSRRRLGSI